MAYYIAIQDSMASHVEEEFTLSFDEMIDAIREELCLYSSTDDEITEWINTLIAADIVKQKYFINPYDESEMERYFIPSVAEALEEAKEAWITKCINPNKKLSKEDKHHISLRLKPTTIATKEHIIDKKILPFFKDKVVYKISVKDVESWHDELLIAESRSGNKYSPTYLRTINNQLSAILNYAVRKHGLKHNPMNDAETIGCHEGDERDFWEVEEYLKFRDAISDKPIFYYAYEVLFWCGLRLGEMQALTAEDIDFEAMTLRVDESYARLNKQDIISAPKTKSSKRTIAIHDDLALELKEYLESLGPIDQKARIFPVSKSGMHHEMERGCKLSGVKKITIHGLRHSHISIGLSITAKANF